MLRKPAFAFADSPYNSQNKSVGTDRLRKQHSHDALMGPQIEDDGAWFQFRPLQNIQRSQAAMSNRGHTKSISSMVRS